MHEQTSTQDFRAKTVPKKVVMPILFFTDLAIRSLKPGLYFDQKTPAFGIRIGKHRKTWIGLKEPNRTKVSVGYYPA